MPKDLQGKEMKGPPGLRGAKSAQAMRVKTIDEPDQKVPQAYPWEMINIKLMNYNKEYFYYLHNLN